MMQDARHNTHPVLISTRLLLVIIKFSRVDILVVLALGLIILFRRLRSLLLFALGCCSDVSKITEW